jgi:fibronectin-binding autotransporter adhesin
MKKEFVIEILCFVVLLFGGSALEAKAATTLYVTDTGDGTVNYEGCYDGCSLREAMRQARDGDTILFARPLFDNPQTITLTSGRPLSLGNYGTVTINGENTVTINGNNSTGIFSVDRDYKLNLWQMKLTNGNAGTQGGGGISVYATSVSLYLVEINNCKGNVGGAISSSIATVNIDHSTLYNNSSTAFGSAIYFYQAGRLSITSSTVSGNTSPNSKGAAIYVSNGNDVNVINSTVTNNSANGGNSAGGIYNDPSGCGSLCDSSNPLYIKSSIVAANPNVGSPNIFGHIDSQTYSLLSGDPLLLPLADNVDPNVGVHIPTHALDNCSPAINAGDPNPTIGTDQRFSGRVNHGRADIGAFESDYVTCPAAVTVTNNNDSGPGSLRQAVNDIARGGTISFPSGGADITLTSGDILVRRDVNIAGNGTYLVTVHGNNQSRIFSVPSNVTLNLSKIVLADGNAHGGGGAVDNFGTLTVTSSAIINNTAQDGGGISNNGTLSITNTTVSGNHAVNKGAGIYNNPGGATASVLHATITNNRSDGFAGAGVWNDHFSNSNTFSARNSIIAGNISGNGNPVDYVGDLTNQGYNLINTNMPLNPLGNYGGGTLTHELPNCSSPAIDAADPNNVVATDQRGNARPFGGRADIGAFESTQSCSIVVQNGNSIGYGTLDQALHDVLDGGRISFAPGVNTIYIVNGPLNLYKNVTINVNPANPVTLYGSNAYHLLEIYSGVTVNLTGLNITRTAGAIYNSGTLNGSNLVIYNNSGGISNYGALNFTNSTVSGNSGGIGNYGGTLSIFSSTLSSNSGGGIVNSGMLSLINSTVSGNQANGKGAGIYNNGGSNILATVVNSTITDNHGFGYTGAGVWNDNGSNTFLVRNSIIDGNFSDQGYAHDYVGGLTNQGNNVIGTRNPGLAPLGNYGGPTQTHALLQNSQALNLGNNCVLTTNGCGDDNAALATDQRISQRKIGANVDAGAFEQNITFDQTTLSNANTHLPYNQQLSATRQTSSTGAPDTSSFAPAQFSIVPVAGQSLPPGLTLSSDGLLSGMPTAGGTFTFTVKAVDTDGMAGAQIYTIQVFAPTAANVSVSGRVLAPDGNGLRNALVILTGPDGAVREARSGSFGYYRFDDVPAGQTYVINVVSKRFQFIPQVVTITEELNNLNFTAPQ